MKIHEYNEMMAHLTRRRPMSNGGLTNIEDIISKAFEKILKQKGKISISDLTKDTGYSKPTIYKYLSENQKSKLISQPSPFKDRIAKGVNKIIDDVSRSKKPLIEASPNKIFEKIYGKKFNIKTDNISVIRNILNENPNWPKIRDAVTNTSTRVGAGNKAFEKIKFKEFDKALAEAIKKRGIPRAGTVEEFILRDLKRHIDQGGKKFKFAKNNTFDKGFKGLKIKDVKKGDTIDFESIKKNDPRFKEYKNVFNEIKKLKLTPYTNPITKKESTLLEGLQQATGVEAPLNIQHNKGVVNDPLKNLSIQTYKANIGAKMVETPEQAQKLGVQTTVKGGKKVVGPKLSFENQVDRLTKFSDRMIKGGGLRTIKTPTETLGRGTTLGSTMIQPELANLNTPAAKNFLRGASRIALGETFFLPASVVLDTYAGLTPAEMALNIATFGAGVPLKDSVQKRKYIADAGFGKDYSSALQKRRIAKTAPARLVGELTEREKQAMFLSNAFEEGLRLKREEQAEAYKQRQQSQLKRGELEVPDAADVPEEIPSIQPEFQEETTETRSLPFGLDRLLPFDDEDEII